MEKKADSVIQDWILLTKNMVKSVFIRFLVVKITHFTFTKKFILQKFNPLKNMPDFLMQQCLANQKFMKE